VPTSTVDSEVADICFKNVSLIMAMQKYGFTQVE